MWNYVEGRCVKTYQGHVNGRFGLQGAFGVYDGSWIGGEEDEEDDGGQREKRAFLASPSEDGSILTWDVQTKEVMQRLDKGGHEGIVLGVDVYMPPHASKLKDGLGSGKDGKCVGATLGLAMVSCGVDRTVRVWRT